MQDPVKYEFDKDELTFFAEYEICSSRIAGWLSWDWAREIYAELIFLKAKRKYKRYLNFKNMQNGWKK